MISCQEFPETVEEFMEEYKMVDTEEVYSNGTEFVPIFRMNQWFEHERAKRGKWIPVCQGVRGGYYICSECGIRALYAEDGVEELSRYCPACGTKTEKYE